MEFIPTELGGYYHTRCPNFLRAEGKTSLTIAISSAAMKRRCDRGMSTQLGQAYGIVNTGAILAKYAHRGLRRRMLVAGNKNADEEKYALILNPEHDARLSGPAENWEIVRIAAPEQQVFVLYLSENSMKSEYPDVDLWLEHWAWVDCDPNDPSQPYDYQTRYETPCYWDASKI